MSDANRSAGERAEPLASSGVRADITGRNRAEASLSRPQTFSDSLMENAPTIVLILDAEGRVDRVNPYFEQKTGYRSSEVVGRDWFETCLPEADRAGIRTLFRQVIERGQNAGHVNPILDRHGRLLEIEWFSQVLRDAAGRFIGLLNIGHDVTDRLEYEKALEQAKREAERANRTKSRFLATASHDLRQPLQALQLLNGALRRISSGAREQEIIEMQSQALAGMTGLLNSLLDISKLEAGAVQPEIRDIPVDEVFHRVQAEFEVQAEAKGLRLIVEDCPLTAHSDPDLLIQLIQNVVANAVRYTREGTVRLSCARDSDTLQLRVEDSGIGITAEQRELIFDEFYRADRGAGNGGLGLGLSIVKRIAHLLDIGIEVQSEPGRGSVFSFTVPAGRRAVRSGAPAGVAQAVAAGRTVLLVDDDASVLAASRMFLELEGFSVIDASCAGDAYERARRCGRAIDLVITDYHVGDGETGIDIVASLRHLLDRNVPAILVTGDTSPAVDCMQMKGLRTMSKPVDGTRLLATVNSLLAG